MKVLVLYITLLHPEALQPREIFCTGDYLKWVLMPTLFIFESAQEKEWYYRWFEPDVVIGIGYWGHTPNWCSTLCGMVYSLYRGWLPMVMLQTTRRC